MAVLSTLRQEQAALVERATQRAHGEAQADRQATMLRLAAGATPPPLAHVELALIDVRAEKAVLAARLAAVEAETAQLSGALEQALALLQTLVTQQRQQFLAVSVILAIVLSFYPMISL